MSTFLVLQAEVAENEDGTIHGGLKVCFNEISALKRRLLFDLSQVSSRRARIREDDDVEDETRVTWFEAQP
jgi:hypothetical protein